MLLTNPFLYRKTLRLEAAPRSVSVVPNSARLLHRRRIAAQTAGVTLAARAAGISRTRVLLAQPAAVSLVGTASLKRQLLLRCSPAEIGLTTSEAILQRTRLAGFIKAEISIEPQPAQLLRNLVLKCQPASITITPNSANFLKVLGSIEAQPQAIAIEGRAADLRASRLLTAAAATIEMAPRPAQLVRTYPLSPQPAGIAVTPLPAILRLSRVLKAVKQDIAISPKAATLEKVKDPFSLSYGAFGSVNPGGSATLTIPSLAIGSAPTSANNKRFVYAAVGVAASVGFTVSGVTIGGVAASLFAGTNTSASNQAQIWVAEIPTGTTASVVVTANNANPLCCGVAVYYAINPATPTTPDASATSTSTGSPVGLDLNILSGGKAIGLVLVRDGTGGAGGTWAGLSENVDQDIRSGEWFTSASGGAPGTPTSISLTRTGSTLDSKAVAASLH